MILISLGLKITITVLLLLLSYIIGSMPFGIWIGKTITGIDVREHGSKNIGTTNCIRVLGKKVGFLVFFFDVLKGMAVILIVRFLMVRYDLVVNIKYVPYICYGIMAILGHSFSIFLKFKGGKSVATSLGVVLALSPLSAIACLIVFGIVFVLTGYVCLCSSFAAIAVVTTGWILNFFGMDHGWILEKPGYPVCIAFSVIACFLIYKHKANFIRLKNGTENCFKKKKTAEVSNEENKAEETK